MTATNHALAGALIGLSIANPVLALPLAFASHFVLDAIPHYDPPGSAAQVYRSVRFIYEYLVLGAAMCLLLVGILAVARPQHWLLAAVCAFVATIPDMFQLPYFLYTRRTGKDLSPRSKLDKFHAWVQWKTGPHLRWVEVLCFVLLSGLLSARI